MNAAGSEARQRFLKRQVEQIRDTAEARVVEVVVKVRSPTDTDDALSMVAEVLRRRCLSASSRDLLPVERERLEHGAESRSVRRALKEMDQSLVAQLAAAPLSRPGTFQARSSEVIKGFLANKEVQASVSAVREVSASQKPPPAKPRPFWTSSSVVLQVQAGHLDELIQAGDVEGIYLNQRLYLPPIVKAKSIPAAVADNKVSAWGLRNIGALATWGAFGARGKGVTIGLLDTGVDDSHPDLKDKISSWAEFDAMGAPVKSTPHDTDKHGTHCAGTIVGGDASGRWIGVAPEARIAAGLVLNGEQGGTHAQILAGIEWAIKQGVDVISMSLGGLTMSPEPPSTYTAAMLTALRAGIPVVTAIGNEGSQTTGAPGNDFLAFAVGATDHLNQAAGFSGGRTQVIRQSAYFPQSALPLVYSKPEVSAPGVAIYSSVPGGEWEHLNGTSMATPHVAGAIALLLSGTNIKTMVPAQQRAFVVQDLLTGSAEELGESGQNHRFGFGRIDVLRAMGYARELNY